MSKPRICPRCKGKKTIISPVTSFETLCSVCRGTGKVKIGANVRFLLNHIKKIYASIY